MNKRRGRGAGSSEPGDVGGFWEVASDNSTTG